MKSKMEAAAVAATVAAVVVVGAAERATFILRDGRRVTGVLSAHTDARTNLINGSFNLGDVPGGTGALREKAYSQDQVVIIDFVGGQPPAAELAQLNRTGGRPQLLVLRDGPVRFGRFDNIIGGDTVSFESHRYAVRDVARVYLDIQAAKALFNVRGEGRAELPGIRVAARRPWVDTGITVRRGQRVQFRATGQVSIAAAGPGVNGPDGNPNYRGNRMRFQVPEAPIGALVGRVGDGAPFAIGSQRQPLVMPNDGVLLLGVNDDDFDNNDGAFRVEIIVLGR
jgi:hypothetical protein